MLSPKCPAKLREAVSLQEMASLITKRTRTAGDGDLHHASTKNSDGTHHCNHAERIGESNQRATVSFSRRKGGDVDSKTTTYWRLQQTQ